MELKNKDAIHAIEIQNFKSYKNAEIAFCPGVNVITGENDSGKSNILKAIRLVTTNQPRGGDYISDSGGDLQIDLDIGGRIISRFRNVRWNSAQNRYIAGTENLYLLSGEKEPFHSFGAGVPEIIKTHLNISMTSFGLQFAQPFLMDKSAPEVARHYNAIVNLDIIDRSIASIAATLRAERNELKREEKNETEYAQKLTVYEWLPEAERQIIKLEELESTISQLNNQWSYLTGLIKDFKRLQALSTALQDVISNEQNCIDLLEKETNINVLKKDIAELNSYIHKIGTLKTAEEECQKCTAFASQVNQLIELDAKRIEISKSRQELNILLKQRSRLSSETIAIEAELAKRETEFKKLMPNTCPIFDVACAHIDKVKHEKK